MISFLIQFRLCYLILLLTMTRDEKKAVMAKFADKKGDTGSPKVQVAIMTYRINELINHLDTHKKDNHSRRGLLLLVGKRKRLLRYLERQDKSSFLKIAEELGLRISASQKVEKEALEKKKAGKSPKVTKAETEDKKEVAEKK